MYLLDTNIVSDARKRVPSVQQWLESKTSTELFVSVITLGEIARGIEMKSRRDPIAADHLLTWLHRTRTTFADRTLPITEAIAIEWGRLAAIRTRGDADGLIAATALVHDLVLVTRNVADFEDTGVTLLNPWAL